MQSSGAYCVNDESSLAFFLCKSGYDVWLGNNRGYFKPQHKTLKPSNPKFWAWNLRQMGCLDIPALVTFVRLQTQRKKVPPLAHNPVVDNVDCSDRPLSRHSIDISSIIKRPSPPLRQLLILFHRPRPR